MIINEALYNRKKLVLKKIGAGTNSDKMHKLDKRKVFKTTKM